jgi:hypothetical protein
MGHALSTLTSSSIPSAAIRLEAALDTRIAKVLARLVGLKEFKRTPAGGEPPMALTSRAVS